MPSHRKEVFHNNIKTCISNCFHTELHRGQHFYMWSSRYSWEQAVYDDIIRTLSLRQQLATMATTAFTDA